MNVFLKIVLIQTQTFLKINLKMTDKLSNKVKFKIIKSILVNIYSK